MVRRGRGSENIWKMPQESPRVIVLAGPNGAGKSTIAPAILQGPLKVPEFVNADTIARGLSAFDPDRAAVAAGRIMLARLKDLAQQRASFAFETTLASRSFAPWIAGLLREGYEFHLVFLWLPSAEMALARVAERVRMGGHSVPEETVRRRYHAGLQNLFGLYLPLTTTWRLLDNSDERVPRLIAIGQGAKQEVVLDVGIWQRIKRGPKDAR
jgi:predicted ABC-type ATPase